MNAVRQMRKLVDELLWHAADEAAVLGHQVEQAAVHSEHETLYRRQLEVIIDLLERGDAAAARSVAAQGPWRQRPST